MNTNTIMYIILFVILILVSIFESEDWRCENPYGTLINGCKPADGMAYRGSTPQPEDKCIDLVKNIERAALVDSHAIKWRRSLVTAIVVCLGIFFFVVTPGGLPKWNTMYSCVFLTYVILYFFFVQYSYHTYRPAYINIEKNSNLLAERCLRDVYSKSVFNENNSKNVVDSEGYEDGSQQHQGNFNVPRGIL